MRSGKPMSVRRELRGRNGEGGVAPVAKRRRAFMKGSWSG